VLTAACLFAGLLAAQCALAAPPGGGFPEDFNPFLQESAPPAGPAPRIQFQRLEHDFGTIAPGSRHEGTFRFTNTGRGWLHIKETVRSTCGCAVPKLTKSRYAPGESGEIKVTYVAAQTPGTSQKKLYVECNDPNHPIVTLSVKVHVVPPVTFHPKQLVLRTRGAQAGCPPILLKSTDDVGFALLGIMATGDVMHHACDPNRIARSHAIQPRLDVQKLKEHPQGYLALRLTHPKSPQLRIPYRVLPEYQMEPPSLVLFNAEPNRPIERKVTIRSNYQDPIAIHRVRSKEKRIPAEATILPLTEPGLPYTRSISLRLIPPPDPGHSLTDTLTVTLENKKVVELPIRLFYRPDTAVRQEGKP
jgi:hypothetical protein